MAATNAHRKPEHTITRVSRTAPWLALYLALVTAPLWLAFSAPRPDASGFAWDFAMALGYAGLAMMGVQFVLTARFKRACAPYGIDLVYYFHRYLALVLLTLIVVHALLASMVDPAAAGPLDPRRAPVAISIGRIALLLLALIVASSLWRKRFRIEYDRWRLAHAALAVLALVAAVAHVDTASSYLLGPCKRAAWLTLALSWLAVIAYVRVLRPWRLRRHPYRVAALRREHGRSITLTLTPVGHPGFGFQPGQFAWLSLRSSPFALREHPFSFSGAPATDGSVTFTIKALGDFSARVGDVAVGETAYVDGPYGAFSCDRHPDARGLMFVAGGIGIAPVMSMLCTLAERGDQRPLLLFYGNRIGEHVVFREQLQALGARLRLRVVHILDEPPPHWSGERGLLDLQIVARHLPDDHAGWHAFVCGPTPMIRIAERALSDLGVPGRCVHSEIFDLA